MPYELIAILMFSSMMLMLIGTCCSTLCLFSAMTRTGGNSCIGSALQITIAANAADMLPKHRRPLFEFT